MSEQERLALIASQRGSRSSRETPQGSRTMARIIPGVPQWVEDMMLQAGGTAAVRAAQGQGSPFPVGGATSTAGGLTPANFEYFTPGSTPQITGSNGFAGSGYGRKRRRRRKLLTCSDKADIAFLHGQLGGGQLGRAAISSLLSRRCG
jgi:hypothetical protein